jgi:hypothetical protein
LAGGDADGDAGELAGYTLTIRHHIRYRLHIGSAISPTSAILGSNSCHIKWLGYFLVTTFVHWTMCGWA